MARSNSETTTTRAGFNNYYFNRCVIDFEFFSSRISERIFFDSDGPPQCMQYCCPCLLAKSSQAVLCLLAESEEKQPHAIKSRYFSAYTRRVYTQVNRFVQPFIRPIAYRRMIRLRLVQGSLAYDLRRYEHNIMARSTRRHSGHFISIKSRYWKSSRQLSNTGFLLIR